MQLADYLRLLRRRGWLIVLAAVVGVAGAALATSRQAKVYSTSAQLIVSVTETGPDGEISRRPVAIAQAVALAQLASTPTAVAAAETAAQAGPGSSVRATADDASPFINLIVTGPDPVVIAQVANAYVKILPGVQRQLKQAEPGTTVSLLSVQSAPVNSVPVSPHPRRNLAVGLVLGLALGLGAALARDSLEQRVLDSGDIERITGLSLLGGIPLEYGDEQLPARTHPMSLRAEAYRLVRANLQFTDQGAEPACLLVTSSAPGDGKTSLATNLAVSCALTGERVVIVDADLRRPRVAAAFGLPDGPGLSELLVGKAPLSSCLTLSNGLAVLPSGALPPNPSELLGSSAMVAVLTSLLERYDRVILDGPPILAVADAVTLSSFVSGVIVVVRIGSTTQADLGRTQKSLQLASATVLGVVANCVRPNQDKAYGYGSSVGYGYVLETPGKRRRGKRIADK